MGDRVLAAYMMRPAPRHMVGLGVFGFLLVTAYGVSLDGAAVTPRWALLATVLPVLLMLHEPRPLTTLHCLGLTVIGWAIISLAWTPNRYDGFGALFKLIILAQAFVLGARLPSLRPIWIGLAFGLAVNSIIAVMQALSFAPLWIGAINNGNAGLFYNPNSLGEIAALVGVVLCVERMWLWLPGVLPALWLSHSRAAWLAVVVAVAVWLWSRSKLGAMAIVGVIIAWAYIALQFDLGTANLHQRFGIWRETIGGITLLGHGFGSFHALYPYLTSTMDTLLQRPEHVHNELIELAFELGLVGTLVAALFAACCTVSGPAGLVLVAVVVEASFGFPLHLPVTGFVALLCAGHIARRWDVVRVDVARGRAHLSRWLAGPVGDRRNAAAAGCQRYVPI